MRKPSIWKRRSHKGKYTGKYEYVNSQRWFTLSQDGFSEYCYTSHEAARKFGWRKVR